MRLTKGNIQREGRFVIVDDLKIFWRLFASCTVTTVTDMCRASDALVTFLAYGPENLRMFLSIIFSKHLTPLASSCVTFSIILHFFVTWPLD